MKTASYMMDVLGPRLSGSPGIQKSGEWVVEKLKGHPLFAHVTLTRSERSPIAALVTEMLENVTL